MSKSINNLYNQEQIEWLITHERTMRRIIDGASGYTTLIRNNIIKQHDAYNAEKATNESVRQKPIKFESNDNFMRS